MRAISLDEKPYVEYIGGELLRKASPKRRHAIVQLNLGRKLHDCSFGLGTVATEWRFHLIPASKERTTLVPDVAFVSSERLAALAPDDREEPAFAPDIAVEVRSPSDRLSIVERKVEAYLKFGATLVLDVLPDERIVRVFTRDGVTVKRQGETITSEEFPWLHVAVDDVFASLDE